MSIYKVGIYEFQVWALREMRIKKNCRFPDIDKCLPYFTREECRDCCAEALAKNKED